MMFIWGLKARYYVGLLAFNILFVQYVYAKVNHLEKVFGKAFYLLEI